ncbi:hypothetical protein WME94_22605 [Sorangium sp. So ce429]
MGFVIPVQQRRAPKGFNEKVYRPGRRWLKENGHPLQGPARARDGRLIDLRPFWRECLDDLHKRYGGICAYVSIYIDPVTGSRTADHFIAKSSAIEHAYRWRNLRLACSKLNGRKGIFDDLLDPFQIQPETFHLNLLTGAISPNPALPQQLKDQAQTTIFRLGLDDPDCRARRLKYFDDYHRKDITEKYLKEHCPFVWCEVHRQGMTV